MSEFTVYCYRANVPVDHFRLDNLFGAIIVADKARAGEFGDYEHVVVIGPCETHGQAPQNEMGCKLCLD